MSIFRGDASDIYELAGDLAKVGARAVPALRAGMAGMGSELARAAAANARETAGEHGKHYPDSIDSELVFDLGGVSVDVGPNVAKKQGGMGKGFEFGSRNQPPHLDIARAMDSFQPRAEALLDETVGRLFS